MLLTTRVFNTVWKKSGHARLVIASITATNDFPDANLIMLDLRSLLTIMFTQKAAVLVDYMYKNCKSICSSTNCCIFCDMNQYIVKAIYNLPSYVLDNNFSSSCIGKSQLESMHISFNMNPSWMTWIKTLHLLIVWMDDAIKHTWIWPLVWHNKYKPHDSSTPLQQFPLFHSQSKRKGSKEGWKDSPWHNGYFLIGITDLC